MVSLEPSIRFTAQGTASTMSEMQPIVASGADDLPVVARTEDRLTITGRFSLTARILIVNILPLALLSG